MADGAITWAKHENLVKWVCWRIAKRYGGDFDELYSEALVLYCTAVDSFDHSLGSLSNWVSFKVYKGLQELKRTEARHLRITGPISEVDCSVACNSDYLLKLCRLLSSEAQVALQLLLELDSNVLNKSLVKLDVRRELRTKLGWKNDKITGCFREIRAAVLDC